MAIFNSFRLHPFYMDRQLFQSLKPYLASGVDENSPIWEENKHIFNHLKDNNIISCDIEEDNRALNRARGCISYPIPHVLYLILTEDCNMKCSYCFINKPQNIVSKKVGMSTNTAKNVLEFFSSCIKQGTKNDFDAEKQIIFYGGEPLLNTPVLRFVVDYSKKLISKGKLPEKTRFSIVTNGTLLTRQSARFLKYSGVEVGISLDGDQIITDKNRPLKSGDSSYGKIIRAISICQEMSINVSLSVTVTPLGLTRKDELLAEILKLNVRSLGFNMLIGDNSTVPEAYNSQVSSFLLEAFDLFRLNGIYEDRMMRKVRSFSNGTLYLFDCAATGGNQIVAAPDGELGICHGFISTRGYFYGNINNGIDKVKYDKVYNEWLRRSPIFMDECMDCAAVAICGGGCPYNAHINTGSIWGKDDRFCIHAKMTLDWLIWKLYENTAAQHWQQAKDV